ncbi:MAG: GWxTD domain-containing protein [Saprospiraceae bacterium]|nr:GWxTD domain-containing protein [Saprospiraceae bacterium]
MYVPQIRMAALLALIFLFVLPTSVISQVQVQVDLARFRSHEQAVVEVQMYYSGSSLTSIPTPDGQWRSSVDVLILFQQDSQIVQYDHFILHSPSTVEPAQDFVDVRRFAMPEGAYHVQMEVFDLHKTGDTLSLNRDVTIGGDQKDLAFALSDPVLLAKAYASKETNALTRNGYYMEPIPHRYYPHTAELLYFYQEVYAQVPSEMMDTYQYAYYLEGIQGDGKPRRIQQAITKTRKARPLDPILMQMDIRKLPSGNYRLVTEVRDKDLNLINTSAISFQRSNPNLEVVENDLKVTGAPGMLDSFLVDMPIEELNYSLRAVAARILEKDVTILNATIQNPRAEAKRQLLFSYFIQENANRPDKAYAAFMASAREVDAKFRSGFGYGFETDRGYAWMKYGQPNDIVQVEDEPHAPPYEIWIYDEFPFTGQRNVKFLFYNPNLAPGDFQLLHSTARNERQNPRWEIELYEKAGATEIQGTNIQDATGVRDQYYRNAKRYFNDF